MTSTSNLPDIDIIILSDSEEHWSSDKEEDEYRHESGLNNGKGSQHYQQNRLPSNEIMASSQQQQPQQASTSTTTAVSLATPKSGQFLKEIFEIVQWVNTGVKRENCEEQTFMEKKFEEMEKALQDRDQELEQARDEISGLRGCNENLESENGDLKQQLESVLKENVKMAGKWVQIKESFEKMQIKYFKEDTSGETSQQEETAEEEDDQPMPSVIVQLKEEPMKDEKCADMELEVAENSMPNIRTPHKSSQISLSPVKPAVEKQSKTVNQKVEIKSPPGDASGLKSMKRNLSVGEVQEDSSKLHGVDGNKAGKGAFCICGLQFSSKRTLDSHIIYFTCEKKFSCGICQKRFVGSNYLKGHMLRSHKVVYTGGSNGCRDCGKTFTTLLQLRRHKKLAHAVDIKIEPTDSVPASSRRNRRPLRALRKRQQKVGDGMSTRNTLQGNCNNCLFCREPKKKCLKHLGKTLGSSSSVASKGSAIRPLSVQNRPPGHTSSIAIPVVITRNSIRARASTPNNTTRSVSNESISYSCDLCQKWFGDDRNGLLKHQQTCQQKRG